MLIQKYQSTWAVDFQRIKELIDETLMNLEISIEHVGSTAVPGLAAKPIIDIDIVYSKKLDFEKIKSKLAQIAYYHNGDQGIKDREVFKRIKPTTRHQLLDIIEHHLYVCPSYSEELKRHLAFRDYLREHEIARKQYEAIKYEIAKEANQNRKIYAQLKETRAREFIETILQKIS